MRVTPAKIWSLTLAASLGGSALITSRLPLAILSILVHLPVLAWGIASIKSQFFGKVLIKRENESDRIALSFDDGPDPGLTPAILDLLGEFGYGATFFCIGTRAAQYPDIVERIYRQGHIVGCHDWDHALTSNFRRTQRMVKDIGRARNTICNTIGKVPLLYRPPVGLTNPHTFRALRMLGMHCIGWSSSAKDAGNRRVRAIEKIQYLGSPGDVILLHDCLPNAQARAVVLRSLRALFQKLRDQHLTPVGIDELFGVPAYVSE